MGSNGERRRNLSFSQLKLSTLMVTDAGKEACIEAGNLFIPANEGLFDWNEVYNLADVIVGYAPQRELPDDITLYKGIGIALEDIATAAHVYRLAVSQNIGEELDILA